MTDRAAQEKYRSELSPALPKERTGIESSPETDGLFLFNKSFLCKIEI